MYLHRLLLLLLPGLYLLLPMIVDWWQYWQGPWYHPFIGWLALILFLILLERRRNNDV